MIAQILDTLGSAAAARPGRSQPVTPSQGAPSGPTSGGPGRPLNPGDPSDAGLILDALSFSFDEGGVYVIRVGDLPDGEELFSFSPGDVSPAASTLGLLGRAVNSDAQAQASRENGALGGRPPHP